MDDYCKYLDGVPDVDLSDDGTHEVFHGIVPECLYTDGDMDECPYPERECPAKIILNTNTKEEQASQEGE